MHFTPMRFSKSQNLTICKSGEDEEQEQEIVIKSYHFVKLEKLNVCMPMTQQLVFQLFTLKKYLLKYTLSQEQLQECCLYQKKKKRKEPKCPSVGKQINNICSDSIEYYIDMKMNTHNCKGRSKTQDCTQQNTMFTFIKHKP